MMRRMSGSGRRSGILVLLMIGCLLPVGTPGGTVQAADIHQIESSLQWIPADAALFCTLLRNREQIEIARDSKAVASLMELPIVQQGLGMMEAQRADPDSPMGQFDTQMKNPMVADAVAMLADMLSDECFLYLAGDAIGPLSLAQRVGQDVNAVRYKAMLSEGFEGADRAAGEELPGTILHTVASDLDNLRVPGFVLGFHVEDPDRAEKQLDNLAGMLTFLSMGVPQMAGRVNRTDIGDHEFLTVNLDGEMIPWNEVPVGELEYYELEDGESQKVVEKVKESTLVVALGLRDDYLLLAVGSSTDVIADLGQGDLLVDTAPMEPLAEYADKPLTSITYVSEDLVASQAATSEDIQYLRSAFQEWLDNQVVDESLAAEMSHDAERLAAECEKWLSIPGAAMGFCYMTESGYESYGYDWSRPPRPVEPAALPLLNHLGSEPVLAVTGRCGCRPEDYDLVATIVERAFYYFDQLAPAEMSDRDLAKYREVKEAFLPIVQRLDKVNRELLVPALAGGDGAVVLDTELKTKRLVREMPKQDEAVPVPAVALVMTVNDADQVRAAAIEYLDAMDEVVEIIREKDPNAIPEGYTIPDPKVKEVAAGKVYHYPLPPRWKVDRKIAPAAALSEDLLVLSPARAQAERLLQATDLQSPGVLAETDRPRNLACIMNWATLVDAATPWIEMAVEENADEQAEMIMDQARVALEALKTLRTISVEVAVEDGVTVSHSRVEIEDID